MTMSRPRPILASAASDRALRIAGPGLGMPLSGPAACSRPRSAGAARRPAADGRPAARRVGVRPRWPGCAGRFPRRAAPVPARPPDCGRKPARPRIPVPCAAGSLRRRPPPRKSSAPYRRCRAAARRAGWRKPSGGGGAAVRIRHFSSKAPVFRPVCEHLRDFEHHAGLLRGIIFACNIRSASDHHQQGVRWGGSNEQARDDTCFGLRNAGRCSGSHIHGDRAAGLFCV